MNRTENQYLSCKKSYQDHKIAVALYFVVVIFTMFNVRKDAFANAKSFYFSCFDKN